MAAEQVIAHIRGLHVDFRNAAVHSKWLEQFQGAPESWAVALELLRSSNEEVIAHFAAHTLVTKLQVGHGQMLNGGGGLQDLLGCIAKFANGPKAVRRALAVGLVDYQLWRPPNEDMEWLRSCTMQMADPAQAACLLELLIAVPEEVKNRKVVIPGERRGSFAACMLQSFDLVLDALTKALQQTSDPQMTTLIMSAFARWLSLQHASPSLRMQRKAGQTSMYCADILSQRNLQDHPLVMQACATISNLATAPEELCHQAADVLIELLELTNEVSPKVRPVQLRIFQAILAGAREIMPAALQAYSEKFMPEELQLATRALMLSRLVSESAFTFARMWIQDGLAKESGPGSWVLAPAVMQESETTLEQMAELALSLWLVRCLPVSQAAVDFMYSVMAVHLGAMAEYEDLFDEDRPVLRQEPTREASQQYQEQQRIRQSQEKVVLIPLFERMIKASWQSLRFPAEPDKEENFEWDRMVRYREVLALNITEACHVVGAQWIIDYIGSVLEASDRCWQDIDACIFTLTGVAARALAGQDVVIPRLIDLLPVLQYPTEGLKAVLMRTAASRLVLFTTGYLAMNEEPCKKIMRFLTQNHLPAIPLLPRCQDPDSNKYCEAMSSDAFKVVCTNASKVILGADNGTFWRPLIEAAIQLVSNDRFSIDARAQMLFGIGQVLTKLPDWDELEQTLGILVKTMEGPIHRILQGLPAEPLGAQAQKTTRDGKGPPELKLYLASVSCVYSMPPRNPELPAPLKHPVVSVYEQNFHVIEKVCLHHTQYDELMEQVCLAVSYIFGWAREYSAKSPMFIPTCKMITRCCEQHPQPFYLGVVTSFINIFAANEGVAEVVVDWMKLFASAATRRLIEAGTSPAGPMESATYAALADMCRHSVLVHHASTWLPEATQVTVEVMPRLSGDSAVANEKLLGAMLRFLRNLCGITMPVAPTLQGAHGLQPPPELLLQAVWEQPVSGVALLARLINSLFQLLVGAAQNNPSRGEVAPTIGEVLQILVRGRFEFEVYRQLPIAIAALPNPLPGMFPERELQGFIQQLKLEKGDKARFLTLIVGLAEKFRVAVKQAQYR